MSSGGKGGGSSGGDTETTIRYAPYLEAAHQRALTTLDSRVASATGSSPYGNPEVLAIDDAMLGVHDDMETNWELKNFPSLWDMFGKFMAGLDVHKLWHQTYQDLTYGPQIQAAVSAQAAMIQDDIDTTVMPKFLAGMRDIGAVHSSSFVVGKSIIQDAHVKAINKFAGDIRIRALEVSAQVWSRHLDWSQAVVHSYQEMMKLYFVAKMDEREDHMRWAGLHGMWDINLMEHVRGMLGALGGGHPIHDENQPSQMQRSIGGMLSGAAAGASVGGPWGAAIGGALGLAASLF
jgi:hypothetical protein